MTEGPASAPPSTTSVWPVTQRASSLARNTAAGAMSSGSPRRRSGNTFAASSSCSSHNAREVGLHQARRDRVHPHLRTHVDGEDPREVDERGLRGVVDADRRVAAQAADRRHVDHRTPVLAHAGPPRELRPHERAAQVHLERLVPRPQLGVDGRAHRRVGAGVVHQHVERAEPVQRGAHAGFGLVGLTGVGSEGGNLGVGDLEADGCGGVVERFLTAGREHHRRAFSRVPGGDREADPARRPGDQCGAAGEPAWLLGAHGSQSRTRRSRRPACETLNVR